MVKHWEIILALSRAWKANGNIKWGEAVYKEHTI